MINISAYNNPSDIVTQLENDSISFEEIECNLKDKVLLLSAATYKGFCKIPMNYHTHQADMLAAKSMTISFYQPYKAGSYTETALRLMIAGCDIRRLHP